MKTGTKVGVILAVSLVLVGCILFAGVMATLHWDFTKLQTVQYETNTHEIGQAFQHISLATDTAEIAFVLSNDGTCRVECHEEAKAKHSVAVEDGTLTVESTGQGTVYDFFGNIGLNFDTPRITVYLPEIQYASLRIQESTGGIDMPKDFTFQTVDIALSTGNVTFHASASEQIRIKAGTGDICVEDLSAETLDLTVSTGRVTVSGVICRGDVTVCVSTGKAKLTDIQCESVISNGDTGDISLQNVIAAKKFSIERGTGNVTFDGSDAAEIFVRTDTGNVTGSLLTSKVFLAQSDNGRVDVPRTTDGGRCQIITDTGNIVLDVQ